MAIKPDPNGAVAMQSKSSVPDEAVVANVSLSTIYVGFRLTSKSKGPCEPKAIYMV